MQQLKRVISKRKLLPVRPKRRRIVFLSGGYYKGIKDTTTKGGNRCSVSERTGKMRARQIKKLSKLPQKKKIPK